MLIGWNLYDEATCYLVETQMLKDRVLKECCLINSFLKQAIDTDVTRRHVVRKWLLFSVLLWQSSLLLYTARQLTRCWCGSHLHTHTASWAVTGMKMEASGQIRVWLTIRYWVGLGRMTAHSVKAFHSLFMMVRHSLLLACPAYGNFMPVLGLNSVLRRA